MKLLFAILVVGFLHTSALAAKPNVILVFIDDMGWGDFSCFGNEAAKTPNIDRMAKEGVRFEQFYVNSPICSPSRTAISTGQYPQRWKITSYLSNRNHNEQRGMAQWLDPNAPKGVVIGKKGADIERLRGELAKMTSSDVHINIVEIRKPEIDPQLIAENILSFAYRLA